MHGGRAGRIVREAKGASEPDVSLEQSSRVRGGWAGRIVRETKVASEPEALMLVLDRTPASVPTAKPPGAPALGKIRASCGRARA